MANTRQTPLKPSILSAAEICGKTPESFTDSNRGRLTWKTLFSQPSTLTKDLVAGIANCPPRNGQLCLHDHPQAELYYVTEGRGIVTIAGEDYPIEKGSAVYIPGGVEHGVRNEFDEELRWLYIFPTSAFNDVVYTFSGDRPKAKL